MTNKGKQNKKSRIDACETEVYFDEKLKCNVTVIKDMSGTYSPTRLKSNQEAQAMGFEDVYHYEGFLHFNYLNNEMFSGYEVDVLHIHSSGEITG